MARIGTVEKSLSADELHEFCKHLASLPNLTLETMREEAAKLGIELSHGAASRFKNGTFAAHLDHLRRAKELVMQIEQFGGADAGASIADAGATVLMQQVYDTLTSGEPIDFDTFSKIISRLRSGDHRLRELNAKLAEYKRREEEWQRREAEREEAKKAAIEAVSADKGYTKQQREKVVQQFKLL